jgi:hypothetical protein
MSMMAVDNIFCYFNNKKLISEVVWITTTSCLYS